MKRPDGKVTRTMYYVQMQEDAWVALERRVQDQWKAEWRAEAKENGVTFVALKLMPDELLPMHGHESPYVAWQERVSDNQDFRVEALVRVRVEDRVVPQIVREKIGRKLQQYPSGTKYEIYYSVNKTAVVLEEGVVGV